ncbi:HAMP domain-containing sensor histidine kinase [Kiritimatiellaeota bacterium B1221]|nr:HAMP domain-containing sensor histidine kinase [Kiritimatiellaeota bacterium B1221]
MSFSIFRKIPVWFFTALVILPVLVLAGVGFNMLRLEQQRLKNDVVNAQSRWLEQSADRIEGKLEEVKNELVESLAQFPSNALDESLMELQRTNPLVRNVFRIPEEGKLLFPKPGMNLDSECKEFLLRYDSLFAGRMQWFDPEGDVLKIRSRKSRIPPQSKWRAWQWADRDSLLVYVLIPDRREIVGVEIEMAALYSRLVLWLGETRGKGEELVLLDRSDRVLVTTGDSSERPLTHSVEMGAMLPFARLGAMYDTQIGEGLSKGFMWVAGSLGVLLLLSIAGGTLGLNAWVNRSRKEALQKTSFVSNVSHEFKTPLTTLRLYSELLLEGRVTDPEKQKKYLSTLRDESERLARLVHNVLDFSRLEMGRSRLHPQRLCLNACLQTVCARMSERFVQAGVEVTFPASEVFGWVDPDAAEQIILNLCDNAIKYAASGGVLRITEEASEGKRKLCFRDEGPGIPEREGAKVFQAFHQVDDRITRESGGTGLGLHISRRLARQMGGDLQCDLSGEGCVFIWSFPDCEDEKI